MNKVPFFTPSYKYVPVRSKRLDEVAYIIDFLRVVFVV